MRAQRYRHSHGHEHAGSQLYPGIRKDHASLRGSSGHVNLWPNVIDSAVENAAGVTIHGDGSGIANFDLADLVLEYLGIDPDGGEVSNGIEARPGLHEHIGQRVTLRDVTGHGGVNL